jgi:DNA-binding transcriptional MerR regulator
MIKIELLKPVEVDQATGYRFYSIKQLPCLNRILFLKELEFSLQKIKEQLDKNLPVNTMKEMLIEKHKIFEEEIIESRQRLEQIKNEGKILCT